MAAPISALTPADRLLRLVTDVRPGEGRTALLLALNVFLLLTAYYILKPVRDALILGQGSAELKTYMSAAQVGVLVIAIPLYSRLASRLHRRTLINSVTWFFVACLAVFYLLGRAGVPIAMPYFVWIGVFNLMIVSQFWSFANDIYTRDEGERLFPIVGFGASLGAVVGALAATGVLRLVGLYEPFLIGGTLLALQLQITNFVDRRAARADQAPLPAGSGAAAGTAAKPSQNGFLLVLRTHYLLLIALTIMLLSTVDAIGEYILGRIVETTAREQVATGAAGGASVETIIGAFYSRYYTLVNVLSLLIQLFVVSRVVKHLGVTTGVTLQPVLSFVSYLTLAFAPGLGMVLTAKVAEKATDYSLSNTVRNMLFLPCSREEKYSAKQAIDSFFYRMGDVISATVVFVASAAGLSAAGYAGINLGFAAAWLLLAVAVGREYSRRTGGDRQATVLTPAGARA
jgi:ATP:ADP antiporter, AAA family